MRAAGVGIPAGKLIGFWLEAIGIVWHVVAVHRVRECLFIGEALLYHCAILIIIGECIFVAGIIELRAVVVFSILCADVRIAREARDFVFIFL